MKAILFVGCAFLVVFCLEEETLTKEDADKLKEAKDFFEKHPEDLKLLRELTKEGTDANKVMNALKDKQIGKRIDTIGSEDSKINIKLIDSDAFKANIQLIDSPEFKTNIKLINDKELKESITAVVQAKNITESHQDLKTWFENNKVMENQKALETLLNNLNNTQTEGKNLLEQLNANIKTIKDKQQDEKPVNSSQFSTVSVLVVLVSIICSLF